MLGAAVSTLLADRSLIIGGGLGDLPPLLCVRGVPGREEERRNESFSAAASAKEGSIGVGENTSSLAMDKGRLV